MTIKNIELCTRLQRLGFTVGNQMTLYGEIFEFLGEPIIVSEEVILMDATERKTGQTRRLRVPLPIVKMVSAERAAKMATAERAAA